MKYSDFMVDIETLGTGSDSVIIQIGMVPFSLANKFIAYEHAYSINIDPNSCKNYGLQTDEDTINWWAKQSDEAKQAVFAEPQHGIVEALTNFSSQVNKLAKDDARMWCHATFDSVILSNAYSACSLGRLPFNYWRIMDIRTLACLAETCGKSAAKPSFVGVKHLAIDDCVNQIEYVFSLVRELNLDI